MTKRKKSLIIITSVILLLVVVRLLLPGWIKSYINNMLDDIPGYTGYVTDVDLHLYRGAYVIDSMYIFNEDVSLETAFFATDRIDLSVEWESLFKGSIVGEIELAKPWLNFVVYKSGDTTAIQAGKGADWTVPIKKLMPIRINRLSGVNGRIHYIDGTADPNVNIYLSDLNFEVTNINNVEGKDKLPSNVHLTGSSIGKGNLVVTGQMNLLKEIPDMDIDLKFEGASLPAFNDFTEAYAKLDTHEGIFNLYTELAIKEGQLEGYIKPILTNIKILDLSEDKKSPLKMVWQAIAGLVVEALENQPKDQFATQVPLSGDLTQVKTSIWPTIGNIFKNAFIQAFSKKTENEVSFGDVVEEKK